MRYTDKDFKHDLNSPEMLHIKDPERYRAFYEMIGKNQVQGKTRLRNGIAPFARRLVEPKGTILELGCSAGYNIIHYATLGHPGVGVELSKSLFTEAVRRRERLEPEVAELVWFIHSDILDLEGPDELGLYDTIIMTEVLEHVIDPQAVLQKAAMYMKPTSKLFISAPLERIGNYSHVRGITPIWLMQVGDAVGLEFTFLNKIYRPRYLKQKRLIIKTMAIGTLK
jgi:2-polyprenyl-3-methyl-5-hydroxy-6-metoxy-1,4-benzoquinol methylase